MKSKFIRAEAIGQLALSLDSDRQGGRPGTCSTEYVRGREAGEAGDPSKAFIAKRDSSFILHGEER